MKTQTTEDQKKVVAAEAAQMKAIEVRLPVVKLRVQDVAYLRTLAMNAEGFKCHPPNGTEERLRLLGLLEPKEVPPCPKLVKEYQDLVASVTAEVRALTKARTLDLRAIRKSAGKLEYKSPPAPTFITVPTKAGRALVTDGTATVQLKKGC